LLASVQYVVDGSGTRKSVLLDCAVWEDILTMLEDSEDAEEMRRARNEDDETVPLREVVARHTAAHPDAEQGCCVLP
jgi:hypothetical protein